MVHRLINIKEQPSNSTMQHISASIPLSHSNMLGYKKGMKCAKCNSFLPSYMALKPCALTAKSVVNQSVRRDPVLTMEEGSWNPDSLDLEEK